MATEPKPTRSLDPATRSQIMGMIRSHIALAGAVAIGSPIADVDVYSKGDSPGPVDQYSKGSPSSILQQVSDPAELLASAEAAAKGAAGAAVKGTAGPTRTQGGG